MAIYPKIAVVSQPDTVPFVYGIRHEGNFRAELLALSSPTDCTELFRQGKADIALLPAAVVPSLRGCEIITDYCIGAAGASRSAVVACNTPINKVRRIGVAPTAGTASQVAAWLSQHRWHIAPEWIAVGSDRTEAAEGEALLLTGRAALEAAARHAFVYDIAGEWVEATGQPLAFDVWVGHKGISYQTHDELQKALTFGLEHTFEAVAASDYAAAPSAYDHLAREVDFLFDIEKHKALQRLWECGLKVAPKVNPG
ncbi:MAG: MqnA/MqnD/SBP family protein [Alistipes sp.]